MSIFWFLILKLFFGFWHLKFFLFFFFYEKSEILGGNGMKGNQQGMSFGGVHCGHSIDNTWAARSDGHGRRGAKVGLGTGSTGRA